jgi:hypothetical protein
LFSLYKQGIKPDFHAEIEQNRSTYFWVNQIKDKEWLKDIRLISVNGIHPDTAELFKDTLLCFKSGESSTYLFQNGMKAHGYDTASLSYAYPTVSNLVLNYVLKIGFKYLYLFGVDLGYADIHYHHSKSSAYFRDDGSEVYDYKGTHGGGIPYKGNFLPFVYTKPEFDVSRKLLEQAIASAASLVEIYNCSNGVEIKGAVPLELEHILLPDTNWKHETDTSEFIDTAFYNNISVVANDIYSKISVGDVSESLKLWREIFSDEVNNVNEARDFIKKQWSFIRERSRNKNDPTFFLFYGSSNYFCGVLTKLLSSGDEDRCELLVEFNLVRDAWLSYIETGIKEFIAQPLKLDTVDVSYLFETN